MSWLDDIFGGKSKKKDADALYKRTTELAGQNRAEQERIINPLYDSAKNTLGTGYREAQGFYDQGRDASLGAIRTGYGAAADTARTYGQRAIDYMTPFINEGRTNARYTNLLGTGPGGTAAQATARADLNQSLINENREALDYEAKQRAAAANAGRVGLNSGRAALVDARATTQSLAGLRGDELSRLESQAAREAGYASRAGDLTARLGDTLTGLETGRAGLEADIYGRDAGNRAGLASSYYGNLAGLDTERAGRLSGVTSDYYGNMAGAAQRQSDAYSATRGTGLNNLAQWGGLALQGFTPTRTGTSAFGNIKNALWGKGFV